MANPGMEDLRKELGASGAAGPSTLPDFEDVPPEAVAALVAALREAKQQQRLQLAQSAEKSLNFIPTMLRAAVRKVLFS